MHTITELHLADAHLAYLSACSTTAPNPQQPDEPAHITTAFQLAGYRTVIGTLWPIHDRTAVDIYTQLTRGGATPRSTRPSPHALHHAVRRLRDKNRTPPTHWAVSQDRHGEAVPGRHACGYLTVWRWAGRGSVVVERVRIRGSQGVREVAEMMVEAPARTVAEYEFYLFAAPLLRPRPAVRPVA